MSTPLSNLSPEAANLAGALGQIDQLRQQLASLEVMLLGGMVRADAEIFPRVWVDRVAEIVALEFGVDPAALRGDGRQWEFTRPRFVWVWLIKECSGKSFQQVARLCAYGDHTSVMHSCRRVIGWRAADTNFALVTDQLLRIASALRRARPPQADDAGEDAA